MGSERGCFGQAVDECGFDYGYEVEEAPSDLEQLNEAAGKLSQAIRGTGSVVCVGSKVRPRSGSSATTPPAQQQ